MQKYVSHLLFLKSISKRGGGAKWIIIYHCTYPHIIVSSLLYYVIVFRWVLIHSTSVIRRAGEAWWIVFVAKWERSRTKRNISSTIPSRRFALPREPSICCRTSSTSDRGMRLILRWWGNLMISYFSLEKRYSRVVQGQMGTYKTRLHERFFWRFFSFWRMRLSSWVTKVLIYIALHRWSNTFV